ncbi:YcxB-like protein [Saccharopolyspora antimicrobica]|uniref:YcxB-like protein n=1 Tax=Saccharopolyspora antimicrobica TaxID=455193 RepID=A0A1I5BD92_9PSEU|nr:YcxB family protein [Saccharopolyspora antimicrobica]RKT86564.1 YcxB-like protein [Saccharopolyspora antimicrobica]SFN72620.1 YcxB-like protein [Saccharopolyspora antimicrobica]
MQISLSVSYDEKRLRRTIRFLTRRQLVPVRVLGGVFIVLGIALAVLDPATPFLYPIIGGGLVLLFAVGPIAVASAMRMQSAALKEDARLVLDDEWAQVSYPMVESRFRWAAIDQITETPEVWHAMFGKAQAMTIPKDAMTPQQQAELAAFVARLRA